MSKTIEFINRNIKNKKEQLKRLEKLKVASNKYDLQINELLTKNTEEDIEHLEQIKCELEAWEVMKKRLIREKYGVFHSKDCSVHNYTRIYLKEIKEDENTEEYETIKKALEVEDESTIKNK